MNYITHYFTTQGFWPSVALTFTMWAFLYRFRTSMFALAFLALPGTAAHEFAHYLVGRILQARPVNFSITPRKNGNSWILGSVSFTHISVFNGAFVAMAPLLLFPIAWFLLIYAVVPLFNADKFVYWFIVAYVTSNFLFGCVPSSQDFKVGGPSIKMYGLYVAIAAFGWYGSSMIFSHYVK